MNFSFFNKRMKMPIKTKFLYILKLEFQINFKKFRELLFKLVMNFRLLQATDSCSQSDRLGTRHGRPGGEPPRPPWPACHYQGGHDELWPATATAVPKHRQSLLPLPQQPRKWLHRPPWSRAHEGFFFNYHSLLF